MAKDMNGKELRVGDRVEVVFEVVRIWDGERGVLNLNLKAVDFAGGRVPLPLFSCNSSLVDKLEKLPAQ